MIKALTPQENSKKQSENTKRHHKLRLHNDSGRSDLGRSVGVTTATQLTVDNP